VLVLSKEDRRTIDAGYSNNTAAQPPCAANRSRKPKVNPWLMPGLPSAVQRNDCAFRRYGGAITSLLSLALYYAAMFLSNERKAIAAVGLKGRR
jgi:hypothetical protein